MGFQNYLNEQVDAKIWQDKVASVIDIIGHKHFKSPMIDTSAGALGNTSLYTKVFLVGDRSDQPHQIMMNDTLSVTMRIEIIGDDQYEVEYLASSIQTKPDSKYYAFGSRKVRTRKYKGDLKKIEVNMDKYFKKVADELKDLKNNDLLTLTPEIINKYL